METNRESATQTESNVTSAATQTDAKLIKIKLEKKTPPRSEQNEMDADAMDIIKGNSTQTKCEVISTAMQTEPAKHKAGPEGNAQVMNKQNKGDANGCLRCDYRADSLSDVAFHRSVHEGWYFCRHSDCLFKSRNIEVAAVHMYILHVIRIDKKHWVKDFFCECQQDCCRRTKN